MKEHTFDATPQTAQPAKSAGRRPYTSLTLLSVSVLTLGLVSALPATTVSAESGKGKYGYSSYDYRDDNKHSSKDRSHQSGGYQYDDDDKYDNYYSDYYDDDDDKHKNRGGHKDDKHDDRDKKHNKDYKDDRDDKKHKDKDDDKHDDHKDDDKKYQYRYEYSYKYRS